MNLEIWTQESEYQYLYTFPANASFFVLFSSDWKWLFGASERKKSFVNDIMIHDPMITMIFSCNRGISFWKMDTSYNKTWDIQRMDYLKKISSRRSHTTHATLSIFSLHSLAEAPVDMTRRIAATHNCNIRCSKKFDL